MFLRIIFAGWIVLSLLPVSAKAAEACNCFCRTASGALEVNDASIQTAEACRATCNEAGERFLFCLRPIDSESRPENNKLCWSQTACESDKVKTDRGEVSSIWGGQKDFCPNGQGYCYNPAGAVTESGSTTRVVLNVPIGSVTTAATLKEYVVAVYTFLLVASGLIAVVMLMIAGLLWMTARGNSGQIGKAKELMAQAVFGLVLIFSAYTIAYMIDPRLVALQFAGVPKVRPINFIAEGTSCEELRKTYKATISPGTGTCGQSGEIESFPEADENVVQGGLKAGDACAFQSCQGELSACLQGTDGIPGCFRCGNVFTPAPGGLGGANVNLAPSATTCGSMINRLAQSELKEKDRYLYCGYDPNAIASALTPGALESFGASRAACLEVFYPAQGTELPPVNQLFLDCKVLRSDLEAFIKTLPAGTGVDRCAAYNDVMIAYGLAAGEGSPTGHVERLSAFSNGESERLALFEQVCGGNPCKLPVPAGCGVSLVSVDAGWAGTMRDAVNIITANIVPGATHERFVCRKLSSGADGAVAPSRCHECGTGVTNACDQVECEGGSLGSCTFIPSGVNYFGPLGSGIATLSGSNRCVAKEPQ